MSRRLTGPSLATLLVLAACVPADNSDKVPPSTPRERVETFTWFQSLDYPDVKGLHPVRVATGESIQGGNDPPTNRYHYGFLLADQGDAFTVLTPDLRTRSHTKTPPETPPHLQVWYEPHSLADDAKVLLEALKSKDTGRRAKDNLAETLTSRQEVFIMAWACWRNGLEKEAAALYDHAARSADTPRRDGKSQPSLREFLAEQLAGEEMSWVRAVMDDAGTSRRTILERCESLVRRFPGCEATREAREFGQLLDLMVNEDEDHAKRRAAGKPFEELSKAEQVAELIFRLRDQVGHQWSDRGRCDIFLELLGKNDTPAHQLVAAGYDAVPALVEVLDDKRFCRAVEFNWRSTRVLRVGDCAEQILQRITGFSFDEQVYTNDPKLKADRPALLKAEARAWYAEVRKKGEKQILVEAVRRGNGDTERLGLRLLEKYPEAALAAFEDALKSVGNSSRRGGLIELVGRVEGDAARALLLAELRQGFDQNTRLAAARALTERGQSEGVTAMVAEWERLRPRPAGAEAQSPERHERPSRLIDFLAGCGNLDALKALGKGFSLWPVDVRLEIVERCHSVGRDVFAKTSESLPAGEPEKPNSAHARRRAIEAILIAALDDTQERRGLSGSWGGKETYDPRVCDLTAHMLAVLAPRDYSFDLAAPRRKRDRALAEMKNVWNRRQKLPLVPVPRPFVVAPVPDEILLPLLDRLLQAPAETRPGVRRRIEELGVGVLPGIRRRLAGFGPGDAPKAALLRETAARVASLVTEVVIAPESVVPDAALLRRLEALEGKPFDPEAFVAVAGVLVRGLPLEVNTFRLEADRDGDGTGVRVTLDLVDPERESRDALWGQTPSSGRKGPLSSWSSHESVKVGGNFLHRAGDNGSGKKWLDNGHPKLTEALRQACADDPDQPLEIRIRMTAHWGR